MLAAAIALLRVPVRPLLANVPTQVQLVALVLLAALAAHASVTAAPYVQRVDAYTRTPDLAFWGAYVLASGVVLVWAALTYHFLGDGLGATSLGVLLGLLLSSSGVLLSVLINSGLHTADSGGFNARDDPLVRRVFLHGLVACMAALAAMFVLTSFARDLSVQLADVVRPHPAAITPPRGAPAAADSADPWPHPM
jgi:hypothetical protein